MDQVKETLDQVEEVKKFTITLKKRHEEDGEGTPTMKVKPKFINETYKGFIEKMDRSEMEVLSRLVVKPSDGFQFFS